MRRGWLPAAGSDRVPSDLALYMLADHGIIVRPATLRTWVRRGVLTRSTEGYDVRAIVALIDRHAERRQGSLTKVGRHETLASDTNAHGSLSKLSKDPGECANTPGA